MLPTEAECRKVVDRALSYARTPDASVSLAYANAGNTRFANNEITTSGTTESVSVVVTATRDGRTGRVSSNETTPEALERAMRRAEELAGLLPPDPEYVGPLAKLLIKDAASKTSNLKELYRALADHIDSDDERRDFLASLPQ